MLAWTLSKTAKLLRMTVAHCVALALTLAMSWSVVRFYAGFAPCYGTHLMIKCLAEDEGYANAIGVPFILVVDAMIYVTAWLAINGLLVFVERAVLFRRAANER